MVCKSIDILTDGLIGARKYYGEGTDKIHNEKFIGQDLIPTNQFYGYNYGYMREVA